MASVRTRVRRKITDESRFAELFGHMPNEPLAEIFHVSVATVSSFARRLGLRKDPDYIRRIRRQQRLGQRATAGTRAKIAASRRGQRLSRSTVDKILAAKRERGSVPSGDRHYRWKGGRAWERFKRPEYLAWRKAVLERDAYTCHDCGRRCQRYEKGLAAHHISPFEAHPDLRYEITNGVTLCRDCHMARHARSRKAIEIRPCACGCGTVIAAQDAYGRERRYVNHHHSRGRKRSEIEIVKWRAKVVGRPLTSEHRRKISAGLRHSPARVGRPPEHR